MTYTFFNLLRDSLERAVASANYYSKVGIANESYRCIGEARAYTELLNQIGHTVELAWTCSKDGISISKATVDDEDLLGKEA